VGSYFLSYSNGRIYDKYVGSSDSQLDDLRSRDSLIAASKGAYFIVFDGLREKISDRYIGSPGRITITGDVAVHTRAGGVETRYSLVSGDFR